MKPGQLSDDELIARSIMMRNGWLVDVQKYLLEKIYANIKR